MAAAGPSKALKSVTKLANTPKTSRIELALALADLDDEPGAVADFITTMPTKLRTTYALLEVGRWLRHTGLAMGDARPSAGQNSASWLGTVKRDR